MINPAELRIGNLIQWDDPSSEYVTVESITFNENEHGEKTWFINGGIIDDFNTIPISEQLLMNAGFEEYNHPQHSSKDNFIIFRNDGAVVSMPIGAYYISVDATFGVMEIKYLHQLQNLFFALTGKELEFKTLDK